MCADIGLIGRINFEKAGLPKWSQNSARKRALPGLYPAYTAVAMLSGRRYVSGCAGPLHPWGLQLPDSSNKTIRIYPPEPP